jgi:hypothetical protein
MTMQKPDKETPRGTPIYGSRIYESIVSRLGESGFVDKDFLQTMRMSFLGKDEEFDNGAGYAIAKTFLESGINWLKRFYPQWLEQTAIGYDYKKPPEDPANFEIIRTKLAGRSRGLFWGVIFRTAHEGLLNGRYAIGGRTFNALIKVLLGFQSKEDAAEFLEGLDTGSRRSWKHPFGKKEGEEQA